MTPTPVAGSRGVAVLALTLACMAWGISFVFIKDSDRVLETALGGTAWTAACWVVAVRFLLAFAVAAPWPFVRRGLTRDVARDAFWLAVPSALGYVLQAAGMRGLEPGTNAFLTSLYTPFTPLLAWLVFRRLPHARILLAVAMAVAGVAVLTGPSGLGFGFHEALVVGGAVCWAVQILAIDRLARRHPSAPFACAFFLWTGLLGLAGLIALRGDAGAGAMVDAFLRADMQVAIWGLALVSTVFTMVVLIHFQPRLDPSRAALLYVLEPAFAAVFAVALHGESFGGYKLAGCLMLLGANVLVEIRRPGGTEKRPAS
jgi:drug/metabolite transporter (DMT)-like permease